MKVLNFGEEKGHNVAASTSYQRRVGWSMCVWRGKGLKKPAGPTQPNQHPIVCVVDCFHHLRRWQMGTDALWSCWQCCNITALQSTKKATNNKTTAQLKKGETERHKSGWKWWRGGVWWPQLTFTSRSTFQNRSLLPCSGLAYFYCVFREKMSIMRFFKKS